MENNDKTIHIKCEAKSYYQLDDLNHFQGNLKSIEKDRFDKLKKSLISDGLPIGFHVWIDKKNKVWTIDGHHRVLALKALRDDGFHIPSLPCVIVQANNKKEAAKAVLINNSKYAKINQESLSDFMIDFELNIDDLNFLDLPDLNMDDFGLDEKTKEGLTDDDAVPEVEQNIHGVTLGDIYQLGNHRLMCGDSTSIDAVEKLMDGQKADIVFTSPPYSDQRTYNGDKDLSVKNLIQFISAFRSYCDLFAINLGLKRNNGEIITYWDEYIQHSKECGLKLLSWNVWDRSGEGGSIAAMTAAFPINHEFIFIFGNTIETNRFIPNKSAGRSTKTTIRQADGSFKASFWKAHDFGKLGTVIKTELDKGKSVVKHPAKFPVSLPENYILSCTDVGENIAEPFGGSGSTLIACEKTNRKCFMMELDPHYCSVIIERWQNFTGLKAKLITK